MRVSQSPFGILSADFWDGDTGPAIADAGGAAAQLVAVYLMSNRDATMLGLYPLDLLVMRVKIRSLTARQLLASLRVLQDVAFATYDTVTRFVWVHEMAKFRLNLLTKPLDVADKKVKAVQRLYAGARPNPFLGPFYDRYHVDLHLQAKRTYPGVLQTLTDELDGASEKDLRRGSRAAAKGLVRGLEGASEGLMSPSEGAGKTVTGSGSVTGSGRSDQEDQDPPLRGATRSQPVENRGDDAPSVPVLRALAEHTLPADLDPHAPDSELRETLKDAAGKHKLPYDGPSIRKAVDSVRGKLAAARTARR